MRRPAALLPAACLGAALQLAGAPARADHTEEQLLTDGTAYPLRATELRAGLWRWEFGVTRQLTLGTSTWPWLLKMPSVSAKYMFWPVPVPAALSARVGLSWLDFQRLDADAPPSTLVIAPVEVLGSYRFTKTSSLHGGLAYTWVRLSGETPETSALKGAAAVSNLQLLATYEHRLSRTAAAVVETRVLLRQIVSSSAVTQLQMDPWTRLEVVGAGRTDVADFDNAWSVVPGIVWSWTYVNLRLGLGWGNFNVPPFNFVLPVKFVVPDLDLFVRWPL